MGTPLPIEHRIAEAQRRWPGYEFRRQTHDEAAGPCPFCREGDDRFRLWADGGYWCRRCGRTGWLDENEDRPLTPEERTELRLLALERRQADQERRLSALERMHKQEAVALAYHTTMPQHERAYWWGQGINDESIARFQLGYCQRCPTDHAGRPSYTIPITFRGQLWNIRHRIREGVGGDKYRPHMAGLPATIFNADRLDERQNILVVEGEKKAIVIEQETPMVAVGIPGANAFKEKWLRLFKNAAAVYIALDPDALEQAARIGEMIGRRARIVEMPYKPDDFFVRYGGGASDFLGYVKTARPV